MTNSLSNYALNRWSRQWLTNEAAKRLELRGRLLDGGITPCSGLLATIRLKVSIGLRVMICPAEAVLLRVCRHAALMAKHLGTDGVVLTSHRRVNSLPLAGRRNRIGRRPDFDFRVRTDGSRGCRDDSEPGGGSAGESHHPLLRRNRCPRRSGCRCTSRCPRNPRWLEIICAF